MYAGVAMDALLAKVIDAPEGDIAQWGLTINKVRANSLKAISVG